MSNTHLKLIGDTKGVNIFVLNQKCIEACPASYSTTIGGSWMVAFLDGFFYIYLMYQLAPLHFLKNAFLFCVHV